MADNKINTKNNYGDTEINIDEENGIDFDPSLYDIDYNDETQYQEDLSSLYNKQIDNIEETTNNNYRLFQIDIKNNETQEVKTKTYWIDTVNMEDFIEYLKNNNEEELQIIERKIEDEELEEEEIDHKDIYDLIMNNEVEINPTLSEEDIEKFSKTEKEKEILIFNQEKNLIENFNIEKIKNEIILEITEINEKKEKEFFFNLVDSNNDKILENKLNKFSETMLSKEELSKIFDKFGTNDLIDSFFNDGSEKISYKEFYLKYFNTIKENNDLIIELNDKLLDKNLEEKEFKKNKETLNNLIDYNVKLRNRFLDINKETLVYLQNSNVPLSLYKLEELEKSLKNREENIQESLSNSDLTSEEKNILNKKLSDLEIEKTEFNKRKLLNNQSMCEDYLKKQENILELSKYLNEKQTKLDRDGVLFDLDNRFVFKVRKSIQSFMKSNEEEIKKILYMKEYIKLFNGKNNEEANILTNYLYKKSSDIKLRSHKMLSRQEYKGVTEYFSEVDKSISAIYNLFDNSSSTKTISVFESIKGTSKISELTLNDDLNIILDKEEDFEKFYELVDKNKNKVISEITILNILKDYIDENPATKELKAPEVTKMIKDFISSEEFIDKIKNSNINIEDNNDFIKTLTSDFILKKDLKTINDLLEEKYNDYSIDIKKDGFNKNDDLIKLSNFNLSNDSIIDSSSVRKMFNFIANSGYFKTQDLKEFEDINIKFNIENNKEITEIINEQNIEKILSSKPINNYVDILVNNSLLNNFLSYIDNDKLNKNYKDFIKDFKSSKNINKILLEIKENMKDNKYIKEKDINIDKLFDKNSPFLQYLYSQLKDEDIIKKRFKDTLELNENEDFFKSINKKDKLKIKTIYKNFDSFVENRTKSISKSVNEVVARNINNNEPINSTISNQINNVEELAQITNKPENQKHFESIKMLAKHSSIINSNNSKLYFFKPTKEMKKILSGNDYIAKQILGQIDKTQPGADVRTTLDMLKKELINLNRSVIKTESNLTRDYNNVIKSSTNILDHINFVSEKELIAKTNIEEQISTYIKLNKNVLYKDGVLDNNLISEQIRTITKNELLLQNIISKNDFNNIEANEKNPFYDKMYESILDGFYTTRKLSVNGSKIEDNYEMKIIVNKEINILMIKYKEELKKYQDYLENPSGNKIEHPLTNMSVKEQILLGLKENDKNVPLEFKKSFTKFDENLLDTVFSKLEEKKDFLNIERELNSLIDKNVDITPYLERGILNEKITKSFKEKINLKEIDLEKNKFNLNQKKDLLNLDKEEKLKIEALFNLIDSSNTLEEENINIKNFNDKLIEMFKNNYDLSSLMTNDNIIKYLEKNQPKLVKEINSSKLLHYDLLENVVENTVKFSQNSRDYTDWETFINNTEMISLSTENILNTEGENTFSSSVSLKDYKEILKQRFAEEGNPKGTNIDKMFDSLRKEFTTNNQLNVSTDYFLKVLEERVDEERKKKVRREAEKISRRNQFLMRKILDEKINNYVSEMKQENNKLEQNPLQILNPFFMMKYFITLFKLLSDIGIVLIKERFLISEEKIFQRLEKGYNNKFNDKELFNSSKKIQSKEDISKEEKLKNLQKGDFDILEDKNINNKILSNKKTSTLLSKILNNEELSESSISKNDMNLMKKLNLIKMKETEIEKVDINFNYIIKSKINELGRLEIFLESKEDINGEKIIIETDISLIEGKIISLKTKDNNVIYLDEAIDLFETMENVKKTDNEIFVIENNLIEIKKELRVIREETLDNNNNIILTDDKNIKIEFKTETENFIDIGKETKKINDNIETNNYFKREIENSIFEDINLLKDTLLKTEENIEEKLEELIFLEKSLINNEEVFENYKDKFISNLPLEIKDKISIDEINSIFINVDIRIDSAKKSLNKENNVNQLFYFEDKIKTDNEKLEQLNELNKENTNKEKNKNIYKISDILLFSSKKTEIKKEFNLEKMLEIISKETKTKREEKIVLFFDKFKLDTIEVLFDYIKDNNLDSYTDSPIDFLEEAYNILVEKSENPETVKQTLQFLEKYYSSNVKDTLEGKDSIMKNIEYSVDDFKFKIVDILDKNIQIIDSNRDKLKKEVNLNGESMKVLMTNLFNDIKSVFEKNGNNNNTNIKSEIQNANKIKKTYFNFS